MLAVTIQKEYIKTPALCQGHKAGSFMLAILCVCLCFVYRAYGVRGRRVERVELQGTSAHIDNIVPRARGNEDRVVFSHASHLVKAILAVAHIYPCPAALNTKKLVNVVVHLNAYLPTRGDAHQGKLHIPPRPERRAEIFVHYCRVTNIENERLAPVVSYFGMLTAVAFSHKCTSKNGFSTVYAEG